MNKLLPQALGTFLTGVVVLGIVLFLPAWTLNYWQAWVFILIFTTSANAIGIYLSIKDPVLLERRKKVGPAAEQSRAQKMIMSLGLVGILGLLVICSLDHRFAWSPVPAFVSLIGDGLVVLGFVINFLVFKENSYGGSSIEVVQGQKVISTGPYALIRHPMYGGVLVMMIGVPLALGSLWGLVVLALSMPVFIWRIFDEEKVLRKELPGYSEYAQKVRFRLLPYLW